ncbi:uncharacterized protein [Prorops nasuta]|uniref:uncharacterized protein n=1 Tax=Prorops nasuta TaxID=863751 RepID=UPI0034CFA7A0
MPQGKLKVKTSLPPRNAKAKQKNKKSQKVLNKCRGPSFKKEDSEANKLKKMITKNVNKAMENELREKALEGKQSLTKKVLEKKVVSTKEVKAVKKTNKKTVKGKKG